MRAAAVAAALVLSSAPGAAAADPVWAPPVLGQLHWGGGEDDAWLGGIVFDVRMLGVAGTRRLSTWPDRSLGLEAGEPVAAALRLGGVAHALSAPWSFVLQLDGAEAMRKGVGGDGPWSDAGVFVGAVVDDAYVLWRPERHAQLVLGRTRVPFTKLRQYDERDQALGAVPFVVDRLAPDRRWGALLHGDLGALSYAGGVFADADALEPRAAGEPVGAGGRALVVAHMEWTPVAPMAGSSPPGKIPGARGPLPSPRRDPWFGTLRLSGGLGVLARLDEAGAVRTDVSFSLQVKRRWLGGVGEVIYALGPREIGLHGELAATPTDRVSLHLRGELDTGLGVSGAWTAGAAIMWHARADRRSRIGLSAWYRRVSAEGGRDVEEDAAVILVQTAL